MPTVHSRVVIPDVDLRAAWDAVSAFDSFPQTMENVLSVEFLEHDKHSALSSWSVVLNGSTLSWIERDTFEPYSRIDFESIEGDLEIFRGQWLLAESANGVAVTLQTEFDLGIPSLAGVLNPIGVTALETNSRSMLNAIREKIQ